MSEAKQNKVGESSSGEVVNGFWSCRDLTDVVPLHTPRGLYLKPIAKINVSVNLPQLKIPGKTISTWEVMEKIRGLIQPDEFASLKVAKSTLEFIRLEGDLSDRCRLQRVIARLDSQRLNLAGFPNILKVRVAEAKDEFPTRHAWDSYFRDAKHMNELKPGERPDTIHITGLPVKWFSEDGGNMPSESVITRVFKKWGPLRRVDVPAADVYRPRMRLGNNIQKFSFGDGIFFEAYIQYVEYMDFVKAMDALRGMKLLKKETKNCLTAIIKVDFDKTKHMSDSSVSHREFERKRLIAQDSLAAEKLRRKEELEAQRREETKKKEAADLEAKETRRKQREEKRKRKALRVFRKQEEDKVSLKIAREEQKLIKAQRQLESIRLLDELFDRIKIKVEKKEIVIGEKVESNETKTDKGNDQESHKSSEKDDKKNDKKSKKLKKKKSKKEKKKKKKHKKGKDSGSSSSDDSEAETANKKMKSVLTMNAIQPSSSTGPPPLDPGMDFSQMYPRFPQNWYYDALPILYGSMGRGRGGSRGGPMGRFPRGRGRGYAFRRANNRGPMRTFNPHIYNEQYYKYFANLAGQDYPDFESDYDDRSSKSRSRSRGKSRSRSRGKSRSRSRNKSRSRSRNKSRSRDKSRSRRSKSRTRNRSRSRSRRRSRRRRRSSDSSGSSRSRRARRSSSSRSRSRSNSRRSRSRSNRRSKSLETSRSRRGRRKRSRSKVMVTRAKSRSVSPKRRSPSSSWSMSKSPRQRSCSWSKTVDEAQSDKAKTPERAKPTIAPSTQTETITPD